MNWGKSWKETAKYYRDQFLCCCATFVPENDALRSRVNELERSLKVAESDRDTFKRYAAKMEPVVDAARELHKRMRLSEGPLTDTLRELDAKQSEHGEKCHLCGSSLNNGRSGVYCPACD